MAGKGLGKGLKALIADDFDFDMPLNNIEGSGDGGQPVIEIEISKIRPNTEQPRKIFDPTALNELAESIKLHGVLQPPVVKKENDGYTIIAGERRFRAAQIAGLKTIPVIVKNLDPKTIMEIAIIENVQREDLNPMEIAVAYNKLLKEFGLTQNELAERVGKNRVTITNTLRLLKLPQSVRDMVLESRLSAGHARAILGLKNAEDMLKLAEQTIEKNWNVRDTENAVTKMLKKPSVRKTVKEKDIYLTDVEERMIRYFMTKINIKGTADHGKIEINYHSKDELNRLLELMQLKEEK